jgi:predicted  nucleic acid-binding Zn ribbon protein
MSGVRRWAMFLGHAWRLLTYHVDSHARRTMRCPKCGGVAWNINPPMSRYAYFSCEPCAWGDHFTWPEPKRLP